MHGVFFILNYYYCVNSLRAEYFNATPHPLEEYILLDEQLDPPPAVNLGTVWDYGV